MIALVRYLRVIHVLAKFENDPWKIVDLRVLTALVGSAKFENAKKKIAKNVYWRIWHNPERILITIFRPTYVPYLAT